MYRLMKNALIGFVSGFIGGLIVGSILVDIFFGVIIGLFLGTILTLFCVGFTQRILATKEFEITPSNKDPQKPLRWYEERVREQINNMGFKFHSKNNDLEVFKPRALYKLYEANAELEVNPYFIRVKGSRLLIRLISSYVEIDEME